MALQFTIKKMNRKAQFDIARKSVYWMMAGFVIVMVVMAFAIIIANYRNQLTHVPLELKSELVAMRFTNIPECFAYTDPISKRVYPGVIELSKFTKEQLFDCYHTEEEQGYKDLNFRLWLKNKGASISTNNYYNKDDLTLIKSVMVKDGENYTKDQLFIFVQENIKAPKTNTKN